MSSFAEQMRKNHLLDLITKKVQINIMFASNIRAIKLTEAILLELSGRVKISMINVLRYLYLLKTLVVCMPTMNNKFKKLKKY